MSDQSARLALPLLQPAQAQKHVTHNEAVVRLDLLVQLAVESAGDTAPPVAPSEGEVWIPGAGASGAWAGQAGRLAAWQGGGWVFVTPGAGWRAWNKATGLPLVHEGGTWIAEPAPLPVLQNLAGLGVGTTSDAGNPLAVAGEATLFSHAGGGHQVKVNKAGPGQTASLLFQQGFSGRAEMGLAGTDDFSLKVSPDGTGFLTALTADRTTGRVSLPQGATIAGATLTGVASDPGGAADGTLWHNTTAGQIRIRTGGVVQALGGGEIPVTVPPAGEFVMTTTGAGGATSTFAATAGRIDLYPFTPRADLVVNGWAVNVTAAVAAAQGRIVLYSAGANGLPDQLLLEGGLLDFATTGVKTEAITARTLWQGRPVWLGIRHSAAVTLSAWAGTATPDLNGGTPVTTARKVLRKTLAFATPAPTAWTYLAAELNAQSATAIWLRMG
jgi:hypothetical protein